MKIELKTIWTVVQRIKKCIHDARLSEHPRWSYLLMLIVDIGIERSEPKPQTCTLCEFRILNVENYVLQIHNSHLSVF